MNEQIRISPIRLIGAEGEQHGIVPTAQALEMAREAGLDLVEVADKERPPVCKIMDYGKFKYAQSKKAHQKTHQQKLKEIRVRPKTGEHDVETKINQARKFLEHNDKVQVNVLFRGREMQHIEEGQRVMNQVLEALMDFCKLEIAGPHGRQADGRPCSPRRRAAPSRPAPKPRPKAGRAKHQRPRTAAKPVGTTATPAATRRDSGRAAEADCVSPGLPAAAGAALESTLTERNAVGTRFAPGFRAFSFRPSPGPRAAAPQM